MDKAGRSPLLEALCILSFTGNGIAIFIYLSAAIWNPIAQDLIREWSSMNDVSHLTSVCFLLFTLLYVISLCGVVLMWRLIKPGFFFYAVSQVGILALTAHWPGMQMVSSVQYIFTALFISLYACSLFGRKPHSLDP
jgi:hypothetical protein